MKGEKRKLKKELVDLLENVVPDFVYIEKFKEFDSNMECVFNILFQALSDYYDKGEQEGGEILWTKEDFVESVLSDFASFVVNDFFNLEESEGVEDGEE